MRVTIAAVGRLKAGPETDLARRYLERAQAVGRAIGIRGIEVVEIRESRAAEAERRINEESIALANVIAPTAVIVILDQRGDCLDSATLAQEIAVWRDASRDVAFVIGGPDGLADAIRARAKLRLAFGAATWPHQLVRVLLLEQVYRAATILSGHPYHRD